MSIDELIEEIRSEARNQRHRYRIVSDFTPLDERQLSLAPTAQASAAPPPPAAPRSLNELLLETDREAFVAAAYQRVLGRTADAHGSAYYREKLDQGYGQTFVVAALHLAPERDRTLPRLPGLGLATLYYNLWRVLRRVGLGSIGRLLNRAYHGWRHLRLAMSGELASQLNAGIRTQAAALAADAQALAAARCESQAAVNTLREEIAASAAGEALRQQEGLQQQAAAFRDALDEQQGRSQDSLAELAARQGDNEARTRQLHSELSVVRATLQAQRHQVDALLDGQAPQPAAQAAERGDAPPDGDLARRIDRYYDAFEARHRGEEAEIASAQLPYLDLIAALPETLRQLPVIDVGSGRGEWLMLLRDAGLPAMGIDLSPTLAAHCRRRGLEVTLGDAVSALRERAPHSAAAVSALHVVEHLPFPALFQLLEEAFRVIAPGGLLLLETPNPENILVGSHTFYHDFSHRNPVTPTSLEFLVTYQGFTEIALRRMHPYGEDAYIREDTLVAERFNGHVYGPQDFALIATRPPDEPAGAAAEPAASGTEPRHGDAER